MKKLLMVLLLAASCRNPVRIETVQIHDTVYRPHHIVCDTVIMQDTITIGANYDSLGMRLRAANQKLNKVQFYVNICNKNPKQDKFLKGWVNRALK